MNIDDYADVKRTLKLSFDSLISSKIEYITKVSKDLDGIYTAKNTRARYAKLMFIFCSTTKNFYADRSERDYPTSTMKEIFFHKVNYDLIMGITHEDDAVEAAVLVAIKSVEEIVREENNE